MKDSIPYSCSIVVPIYNESELLTDTHESIKVFFDTHCDDYEIIYVNDGSSDGSLDILLQIEQKDTNVRVMSFEENKGIGAALRIGFESACKEVVVYTDCDLPFDLEFISEVVPCLNEFGVVRAARSRGETFFRSFLSFCYDAYIAVFFGRYIRNVNAGMKVMRKNILKKMTLYSDGSFIDAELILELLRHNVKVKEVLYPTQKRGKGSSKLLTFSNVLTIFREAYNYKKRQKA